MVAGIVIALVVPHPGVGLGQAVSRVLLIGEVIPVSFVVMPRHVVTKFHTLVKAREHVQKQRQHVALEQQFGDQAEKQDSNEAY